MKAACAAALLALGLAAQAQGPAAAPPPDPVVERRVKELGEHLRCLVCQNQTIADSNAPLAVDLRNQIRGQIAQGRSDDQIRDYMVERYGDFVLYRPPFRATTALLWVGPFLLAFLAIGGFILLLRRRRGAPAAAPLDEARRGEIEALLEGREPPGAATPPPKKKGGRAGRP